MTESERKYWSIAVKNNLDKMKDIIKTFNENIEMIEKATEDIRKSLQNETINSNPTKT